MTEHPKGQHPDERSVEVRIQQLIERLRDELQRRT